MLRIVDLGARKNARMRDLLGELREVRELRELRRIPEFWFCPLGTCSSTTKWTIWVISS